MRRRQTLSQQLRTHGKKKELTSRTNNLWAELCALSINHAAHETVNHWISHWLDHWLNYSFNKATDRARPYKIGCQLNMWGPPGRHSVVIVHSIKQWVNHAVKHSLQLRVKLFLFSMFGTGSANVASKEKLRIKLFPFSILDTGSATAFSKEKLLVKLFPFYCLTLVRSMYPAKINAGHFFFVFNAQQ